MQIRKIVVGTDFSPASEIAAKLAMNVARKCGADIMLVHAGNMPAAGTDVPDAISSSVEELQALVKEGAAEDRENLETMRTQLTGQGVEVSHVMIEGFPDTAVCAAAEEYSADLVVTGTHGRSGLKRFLLGSVAERVVRMCTRSVLVARSAAGAGGFKKILVATDFTDLSLKAVDAALALATDDAEIELIHCWELPPGASSNRATEAVLKPILKAVAADVEARGNKLKGSLKAGERTVRFRGIRDAPAQGIQDRLAEEDFELLILGSHGRRGIRRFLLGSVAESSVRHATCSVLIVRDPQAAAAS